MNLTLVISSHLCFESVSFFLNGLLTQKKCIEHIFLHLLKTSFFLYFNFAIYYFKILKDHIISNIITFHAPVNRFYTHSNWILEITYVLFHTGLTRLYTYLNFNICIIYMYTVWMCVLTAYVSIQATKFKCVYNFFYNWYIPIVWYNRVYIWVFMCIENKLAHKNNEIDGGGKGLKFIYYIHIVSMYIISFHYSFFFVKTKRKEWKCQFYSVRSVCILVLANEKENIEVFAPVSAI